MITKFVALGRKTYSYLTDDGNENKKAKGTKTCVIKQKLKFEDYDNCLKASRPENNLLLRKP